VRVVGWALLALLALTVVPVVVLVFFGLIRRFQIARTARELRRLGFVGSSPSERETRSIWPRVGVGLAGLVALIIAMSMLPGGPLGRTLAATVVSGLPAPTHAPFIPSSTNTASEHPSSDEPATTDGTGSSPASSASAPSPASPRSPAAHTGGDGGAPSSVTALPASATAIQLQWDSVTGAAGYDVERSTDSVTWSVVSQGRKQTRFTDSRLKSGTTYFYRVAAYVDGDDVVRSDVVSATTTGVTPAAPVLLSATGSATSVDLVWTDVDSESGYRIERSPDGTSWAPLGNTGQGVTSYTDNGLPSATTYYYRVVAITSDGGASDPSAALPATTTDTGDPSTTDANANAAPSDPLNGP
jgi:hypothetical protein